MKKPYETPVVEKITFSYRDQVVAASGLSGDVCGTENRTPEVGQCLGAASNARM